MRQWPHRADRRESSAVPPAPVPEPARSMSPFMADARFLADRALGLARRGWISLHTRGLRASFARLRAQFLEEFEAGLYGYTYLEDE